MIWYYILLVADVVQQRSTEIEAEERPEPIPPYNETWSEEEWQEYAESVPNDPLTIWNARSIAQFEQLINDGLLKTDYKDFRINMWTCIVNTLGGWSALTTAQKEFVALNRLGTKAQRAAALTDEEQQILNYLLDNNLF